MLPNTFLLGTPKSGTTSLFSWLSSHPQVARTVPKEPFYLMDADSPLLNPRSNVHLQSVSGYTRFFPAGSTTAAVRVDGCCQYIYQRVAVEFIRDLTTETACIVLLREPTARVRSAFQYFAPKAPLVNGHSDLLSVVETLLTCGDTVPRISESARYNHLLSNLLRHSEYVVDLRRWRDGLAGSRARLLVYTFEELRADPSRLIGRICSDLGIDATWAVGRRFDQENATRVPKSRRADNWVKGMARRSPSRRARTTLLRWNARWNSRNVQVSTRDREAMRLLDAHFAPLNAGLASEFPLDLAVWRKRTEEAVA